MLLQAYAGLIGLALFLNRSDWRMLALTIVVAASVFIPAPRDSAFAFYAFCASADLVVGLTAFMLRARGSDLVLGVCVVLEAAHVMGYILNGYPPLSAYRIIVPMLESAQLVICVCMSPALYLRLRNRT